MELKFIPKKKSILKSGFGDSQQSIFFATSVIIHFLLPHPKILLET